MLQKVQHIPSFTSPHLVERRVATKDVTALRYRKKSKVIDHKVE